jgi:hypothetical protein
MALKPGSESGAADRAARGPGALPVRTVGVGSRSLMIIIIRFTGTVRVTGIRDAPKPGHESLSIMIIMGRPPVTRRSGCESASEARGS